MRTFSIVGLVAIVALVLLNVISLHTIGTLTLSRTFNSNYYSCLFPILYCS